MRALKNILALLLFSLFTILFFNGCFFAVGSSPDNVIYTQPTNQQAPQSTLMSPYDIGGPIY
jgi:hypothetical protein